GQVYDLYENGRWFISNSEEGLQNQSVDMEIPDIQNRARLIFTFDVYMPSQLILFTAGQPISVNHNAVVLYKNIPPSETKYDVLTLLASPALKQGDLVRIASMMGNPIISELQTASTQYPNWALENYLQLPENFSAEIQALAAEITQPYNNPYDKAAAITNYLRNAIQYSPAVSIPEDVEDPLAYFLFDLKSGFCNYSASAAVLMLRSVGIPARLAVGYAEGESKTQSNVYTVRERDYHAWPEVYFPEYGWVEFEPTGNQEPISRPTERAEQTASSPIPLNPVGQAPDDGEEQLPVNNEALVEEQEMPLVSQNQIRWLSLLAGIILLIMVGIFIKRKYAPQQSAASILKVILEKNKIKAPNWLDNFLIWSSLPSIEKSFQAINTGLRQLDKPQPLDSTPIERANALKKLLPRAESSIDVLLHEYQNEMFSKTRGNEQTAKRAAFRVLTYAIWARVKFEIMGYN
ncbi:MAG: transglutaminase-like domain-containing protein, partial [Anaerolineales bacterium]